METRKIGTPGFSTSAIGLGAMSFSGIYGNATQEEAFAVLDACLENGITHIDTANVYGNGRSEQLVGEWFDTRGQTARDAFTVATKASITRDPDSGKRMISNSRAHLESELDKSLALLGQDSVDLFYIHRRQKDRPIEELGSILSDLIATGKCKSVGISEVAPSTARQLAQHCNVAAVQSEYSLSTRSPELGLVQTTRELGISLVAFSPVGRGLLTDTPPTRAYIEASGFMKGNPRFQPENLALNIEKTAGFRALSAEMGVPAAGLAIAWALAQGEHVVPIPGTRNVSHLHEAVAGCSLKLSAQDLERIEAVLPVGWAHGDRYSDDQWTDPERYC